MQNYDLLVEKIACSAGLQKEEIERRIEAKKAKLSGLISKEGAAQIIAAELGINFENEVFRIRELVPGMKKINLIGKIINLFPVREYNKNGRQGKIGSLIIADETGSMRVVLWDTNHISLIENGEIKSDDVVEIKNCTMRENEIHLTSFSELKKSKEKIENVQTARVIAEKTIAEIQENQPVRFRAVIVQIFPPRFFTVCNECGKKVVQEADGFSCQTHGRVMGRERALLNLVLDDGTETMRSVLFSDQISKLMSEEDLKTKFEQIKRDLLGTEVHVQGTARRNQMFNNIELTIQDISRVDVDKLIEELEKS